MVTSGQPAKPRGEWVRKVEDKKPTVDLDKIKETFIHTRTGFCIPDPPSAKGKELQISNKNMELRFGMLVQAQWCARKLNLHSK